MHCMCNTLLPYSYEITCISFGYKELNRKKRTNKILTEKKHLNDYNMLRQNYYLFAWTSTKSTKVMILKSDRTFYNIKKRKLSIKNQLVEKNQYMDKKIEQNLYSSRAKGF